MLQPEEFGHPEPRIRLYDTIQDMVNNNKVNELSLSIKTQPKEHNNYFMAHGFQFDPKLERFAGVWNLGLTGTLSFIKQIGDGIWYGFLKKIYDKGRDLVYYTQDKIEKMLKKMTKKFLKKNKDKVDLNSAEKQILDDEVKQRCKSELHREAIRVNRGTINKIVKYIPELINWVIPSQLTMSFMDTHIKGLKGMSEDILRDHNQLRIKCKLKSNLKSVNI